MVLLVGSYCPDQTLRNLMSRTPSEQPLDKMSSLVRILELESAAALIYRFNQTSAHDRLHVPSKSAFRCLVGGPWASVVEVWFRFDLVLHIR